MNRGVSGLAAIGIDAATRWCAVLGHPIRHSASPAMQNAGLAALGLRWGYLAFDVEPARLGAAIDGARAMGFVGLNLTVPHKLLALDLVEVLDDSAALWGAVNTIRFEAEEEPGLWQPLGRLEGPPRGPVRAHGFNTDAGAISRALREELDFAGAGASALVLGAGGAGRTVALKLAHDGVRELCLVNRTRSKAVALAAELRARHPSVAVTEGYPAGEIDLVVNATSCGLKPEDPPPWDGARFSLRQARCAYDLIYRPAETPFLAEARAAGCRGSNGLGMLLYQGAAALEIWTGRPAPLETMRQALVLNVYGDTASR